MYLGMYVHMHWSYGHPYAARTWTEAEWRGYAGALKALGYNMVMIWPITDTMPDPLTASDRAHLAKIGRIIDMLHDEFGMAAMITFGPNCRGNDVAAQYAFEDRPFFKTELRTNPGDPAELAALIDFRKRIIAEYLSKADGFVTIDSDPGGYIGSTNAEFVNLLWAHLDMLDEIAPQATLYYWMWMGWERYNHYWAWVHDLPMPEERSIESNFTEVIDGLLQHPERRWGLLSCNENHHPLIARYNVGNRTIYNPYGEVEYEPTIPLTNYTPERLAQFVQAPERAIMTRGTVANCQTHVAQLPHTYLYAHFAQGGSLDDADLGAFADGVLPGAAPALVEAWTTMGDTDTARMRRAAFATAALAGEAFQDGPYSGLLFGDPRRYLEDLATMLRFRADILDFAAAINAGTDPLLPALRALHATWTAWTERTGYNDNYMGPVDDLTYKPLQALNDPALNAILADLHDWKKIADRHGIIKNLLAAIEGVLAKSA